MKIKNGTETEVYFLPTCQAPGETDVPAAYDSYTKDGIWAYLCEECFAKYGTGLGVGVGQRLIIIGDYDVN